MVEPDTLKKVANTVNEWAEAQGEEPVPDYDTNFIKLYQPDSLGRIELIMGIEKKFDIRLPEEDANLINPQQGSINSINSITEYIDKRLQSP